jgi:hypothetical protein
VANCKSCDARITWVVTTKGNSIPIDVDPAADGNIVLRDGIAVVLSAKAAAQAPERTRYKAHFATCPNAAQHRKAVARG